MAARPGLGSGVADVVRLLAGELARNPAMIGQAGQLAMSVARASRHLTGGRRAGDIARQVGRVARRHPALFIVGGLAAGIALTRLAKALAAQNADRRVRIPREHYTIVSTPRRTHLLGD